MSPERCHKCRWWDASSESDRATPGTTGQCRGAVPTTDDRTGLAMWPYTDQYDWCREWEESPAGEKGDDSDLPF